MTRKGFHVLTPLAALLLASCGGGGSSDPGEPPTDTGTEQPQSPFEPVTIDPALQQPADDDADQQSEPDAIPQNQGEDRVVVADLLDENCSVLLREAYTLYGEATQREDVTRTEPEGSVNTAVAAWAGILTIMTFEHGTAIDGCVATYAIGGPVNDVPAITVSVREPAPTAGIATISPTFNGRTLAGVIEVNASLPASQQPSIGGFDSTSREWDRSLANPGPAGNATGGCFTFLGNMIVDRGVPDESTPDGSSPMTWWYLSQGYAVTFINTETTCTADDYRFSPVR